MHLCSCQNDGSPSQTATVQPSTSPHLILWTNVNCFAWALPARKENPNRSPTTHWTLAAAQQPPTLEEDLRARTCHQTGGVGDGGAASLLSAPTACVTDDCCAASVLRCLLQLRACALRRRRAPPAQRIGMGVHIPPTHAWAVPCQTQTPGRTVVDRNIVNSIFRTLLISPEGRLFAAE